MFINRIRSFCWVILSSTLSFTCSTGENSVDFEYLKIYTWGDSDSITYENRGAGLGSYLEINSKSKSVLYHSGFESTFLGDSSAYNMMLKDTVYNLLHLLRKYPGGIVPDRVSEGHVYCGPSYVGEIKDRRGVQFNEFIVSSDTIAIFSTWFHNLFGRISESAQFRPTYFNADSVAIALLKKRGYFDSLPMPFLVDRCDQKVSADQLVGFWRAVSTHNNLHQPNYSALIFTADRKFKIGKAGKEVTQEPVSGRYTFNNDSNLLELVLAGHKRHYKILNLSGNCFEYEYQGRIHKFGRLPEDPFLGELQ